MLGGAGKAKATKPPKGHENSQTNKTQWRNKNPGQNKDEKQNLKKMARTLLASKTGALVAPLLSIGGKPSR